MREIGSSDRFLSLTNPDDPNCAITTWNPLHSEGALIVSIQIMQSDDARNLKLKSGWNDSGKFSTIYEYACISFKFPAVTNINPGGYPAGPIKSKINNSKNPRVWIWS